MREYLSDGIDNYLAFRASQSLGKRTLQNEKGILKRLLVACGNIYIDNIGDRHVVRYFEEAAKTRGPGSLQMDHTILGQFFEWARRTHRMKSDNDPMAGRRRPRSPKKERTRIHVSQFPRLLELAGEDDPRDRMVMALLMYTLLREQEVAHIRLSDVDLDAGLILVHITKSHLEDRMPICAELDTELRSWLTYYHQECGEKLNPHSFLVPSRRSTKIIHGDNGRMVGHEFEYWPHKPIARIGAIASKALAGTGFPLTDSWGRSTREGAHTIRRSGARALFDRLCEEGYDGSLRVVQQTLHHASMEQTEHYIGITADRKTRDDLLRHKPMYPGLDSSNIVRLTV